MERSDFLRRIGPVPSRGRLDLAVVSTSECDGHVRSIVEYDVEPGERIRAYLLQPTNVAEGAPALFCHHQHASDFALGKSEPVGLAGDEDQAIAPELARRGYVVLVPDAIAFEERNWSLPSGRAEYHELVTRLVRGETLLAKVLGDVTAGIDVLAGHAAVDDRRIGFIGHSYGGRMAIWAAAFDRRIRASVSNCGCVNYKDSLAREVGIQAEFCVPGILGAGDVEDVVRLIAPRALMISATEDDKYSRGARAIHDHAVDAFPDGRLVCEVWPGGHAFTPEMRKAAYRFLDRQLLVAPPSVGAEPVDRR